VLEVAGLRKRFGAVLAVDDVSFRVAAGETVGLLGPNGAGKTTTVSMISGQLRPDAGDVRVEGRPLRGDTDPAKRKIGLVPQELALFDELSALENLRFFGALYDLGTRTLAARIDAAVELVGLADRRRDRVKTFSGGMKRRLNLAAALLHDPALILMDEPTVGVDPQSRNAIFENLEELARRGKAIVYTTHYMEEAERLCDRVVIIDHGRVIADDQVRSLFRRLPQENRLVIELEEPGDRGWLDELGALPGVVSAALEGDVLTVALDDLSSGAAAVLAWVAGRGLRCHHVASERGDLESVFLHLTGKTLRDA
jgi:ABC-2 type transport system ATP-binding protein